MTPTWTEVTGGNWGDRWDIAYGSGSINADRMKRLYMTQPYYSVSRQLLLREGGLDLPDCHGTVRARRLAPAPACSHEYYLKGELVIHRG